MGSSPTAPTVKSSAKSGIIAGSNHLDSSLLTPTDRVYVFVKERYGKKVAMEKSLSPKEKMAGSPVHCRV